MATGESVAANVRSLSRWPIENKAARNSAGFIFTEGKRLDFGFYNMPGKKEFGVQGLQNQSQVLREHTKYPGSHHTPSPRIERSGTRANSQPRHTAPLDQTPSLE